MQQPLRVGVVGPGLMWEMVHKGMLAKRPQAFCVAGFCASSSASQQRCATGFPGVPFFHEYRALAHDSNIDAVMVLTPIPLNGKVALAAVEAGKHLFVEKPLACDLADAEAVVELEASCGHRVFVLEQVPYDPLWEKVAEVLQSGVIGELVSFERINHFLMDPGANNLGGLGATPWRIHPQFPLGAMLDGGVHDLALFSKLFGSPVGLYAVGSRQRKEYGEYSEVSVLMEYGHGLKGYYSLSSAMCEKRNSFVIRGVHGLLTVEHGAILVEKRTGESFQVDYSAASAHDRMYDDFIRCLEEERNPLYPSRAAVADLRVVDAIARSLQSGNKLAVAW